jgi:hypothetical protein
MPDDRRDGPDTPPDAQQPDGKPPAPHAGGFTLDLSSGPSAGQPEAWRRRRKQASPILTKVVDLSTPKPAAEPPPPKPQPSARPKAEKPKPPQGEKRREKREKGCPPGGATLADLLDEATLARLRGKG